MKIILKYHTSDYKNFGARACETVIDKHLICDYYSRITYDI